MNRRNLLRGGAAWAAVNLFNMGATTAKTMKLFVPPEEAPHELTFMQWPVSGKVYSDQWFLNHVQETIANIANTIAEFEPVIMLVAQSHQAKAKKLLSSKIELWNIPTEDLWCRDSGPLFAVKDNRLVVSHIQFNGWGNKQAHQNDGQIAKRVAGRLGIKVVSSGIVGEAGGVDHDGHGLLLAHESSWLNSNRNPELFRDDIEQRLLNAYGAEKMIWSRGVYGEDITDYHIDSLARFTGPRRVLINLPDNPEPEDPFHMAALETHDKLKSEGLEIEVIPEPRYRRVSSIDFVASYANYYVCNGGVIAAQFGDKETDEIARDALQRHYPNREIVMLNVDALGELGGGIHCATQQMPSV